MALVAALFGILGAAAAAIYFETAASASGSGASATATTPAPSITGEPANPSNSTSATFTYSDTKAAATFMCSLNSAAYSACIERGHLHGSRQRLEQLQGRGSGRFRDPEFGDLVYVDDLYDASDGDPDFPGSPR